MSEFIRGQYDYIYFFYGLAFFLLAALSFSMGSRKPQGLPWALLGAFGLFHGVNEWLEIFAMNSQYMPSYALFHQSISVLSYLFLLEFSRQALFRLYGKSFASFVYGPLLLAVVSGYRWGAAGFNAAAIYILGLPAGALSAQSLYKASVADGTGRKPLAILSVALGLYTVASCPAIPLKMPILLVRGLCVLASAIALWFYSQTGPLVKYELSKSYLRFRPSKWVVPTTFVILIAAGWLFTNYFDYYAGIQIIKNSKANKRSPLNRIVTDIARMEYAAIALGRTPSIIKALMAADKQSLEKASALLMNHKGRLSALDCYIFAPDGRVMVSTGGTLTGGQDDRSYVKKPYFRQAAKGRIGYFFTVDADYAGRTYFVSSPVRDSYGRVAGVAVIMKNISALPVVNYRLISIAAIMFISLLAIGVFIAWGKRENLLDIVDAANRRLKEVDNLKSDFISVVSHELRTPLTAIRNAVTILLRGVPAGRPLSGIESELLEIILKNTDRQTRMVNDLLDISKIEARVIDVRTEHIDIIDLTRDVIQNLAAQADQRDINVDLNNRVSSLVVPADPDHTRRILNNLVANAIRFTPIGGKVEIRVDEGEKEATVAISDTGIGISEEEKDRIFNKFYRAPDAAARQKGGTGLGLVISRGLVEAQGGKMWVESRLGEGSTFYFTLPLSVKKKGENDEDEKKEEDTHNRGRTRYTQDNTVRA